jgi:hypothetical protein
MVRDAGPWYGVGEELRLHAAPALEWHRVPSILPLSIKPNFNKEVTSALVCSGAV